MTSSALAQARNHYLAQQTIKAAAVLEVRRQIRRSGSGSPKLLAALAAVIARYQLLAATRATQAIAQDATTGPGGPVTAAAAFAGVTAWGFPLADPLTTLLDRYAGQMLSRLPTISLSPVDRFVASEVGDAGRSAGHVEIVAGAGSHYYVRVLNLPSCERCVPLAGRVYRDLEEFDRHPQDDCGMWPVESEAAALRQGLVTDPIEAIRSGQVRGLSEADRRAILEDGADVNQVINAHRGMTTGNLFGHDVKITLEGTTKHGVFGGHTEKGRAGYTVERIGPYGYVKNQAVRRSKAPRLRPETLYRIVDEEYGGSHEQAVRLLKLYGYILPWAD